MELRRVNESSTRKAGEGVERSCTGEETVCTETLNQDGLRTHGLAVILKREGGEGRRGEEGRRTEGKIMRR